MINEIIRRIIPIPIIAIGFILIWQTQNSIDVARHKPLQVRIVEELMYFPSGKFLKPMVIEYETAMADLVWLRAVQYYGQHLITDRKFIWLDHIFDILTTLDPRFIGAYHFGSIVIAWDARQVTEALKLLNQGMTNNPLNWQLVFDAGFIHYMITKDYVSAGYYFEIASKLPETWALTERWAAFAFDRGGAKEMAIEIWQTIYQTTENRKLKEKAEQELRRLGILP